jgi:hypothetical protein
VPKQLLVSWDPSGIRLIEYWRGRSGKAERDSGRAGQGLSRCAHERKSGRESRLGERWGFKNVLGWLRTQELVKGRGELGRPTI